MARQENLQARLSGTPASIKAYLIVTASNLIMTGIDAASHDR